MMSEMLPYSALGTPAGIPATPAPSVPAEASWARDTPSHTGRLDWQAGRLRRPVLFVSFSDAAVYVGSFRQLSLSKPVLSISYLDCIVARKKCKERINFFAKVINFRIFVNYSVINIFAKYKFCFARRELPVIHLDRRRLASVLQLDSYMELRVNLSVLHPGCITIWLFYEVCGIAGAVPLTGATLFV